MRMATINMPLTDTARLMLENASATASGARTAETPEIDSSRMTVPVRTERSFTRTL